MLKICWERRRPFRRRWRYRYLHIIFKAKRITVFESVLRSALPVLILKLSQFFYFSSHAQRPRIWGNARKGKKERQLLKGFDRWPRASTNIHGFRSAGVSLRLRVGTHNHSAAIIDLHSMLSIEDSSQLRGPPCSFAAVPLWRGSSAVIN